MEPPSSVPTMLKTQGRMARILFFSGETGSPLSGMSSHMVNVMAEAGACRSLLGSALTHEHVNQDPNSRPGVNCGTGRWRRLLRNGGPDTGLVLGESNPTRRAGGPAA